MAPVQVIINGKSYRMACDDGQEAHLRQLAQRLDETIDSLKGTFGEIGDTRLAIMAGIVLCDQVAELERKATRAETERSAMAQAHEAVSQQKLDMENNAALAMEALAIRMETLARGMMDELKGDEPGSLKQSAE